MSFKSAILTIIIIIFTTVLVLLQINPNWIPNARISFTDNPSEANQPPQLSTTPENDIASVQQKCQLQNTEPSCYSYQFDPQTQSCQASINPNCCSNSLCETGEDPTNCPQDCVARTNSSDPNTVSVLYLPEQDQYTMVAQVLEIEQPGRLNQVDLFINYAIGTGPARIQLIQGTPNSPGTQVASIPLNIHELNRQKWHSIKVDPPENLEPGTYHLVVAHQSPTAVIGLSLTDVPSEYATEAYNYIPLDSQMAEYNLPWQKLTMPLKLVLHIQ